MLKYCEYLKSHTFDQTLKYYKGIGSRSTLQRIRNFINNNGNKSYKIKQITKILINKFNKNRNLGKSIHDTDIKKWAFNAATFVKLDNFKASPKFLYNYKNKNKISRKITKFITKNTSVEEIKLIKCGKIFTEKINELINENDFKAQEVFNSDQTRFEYEMTSARTLSQKGEKETFSFIQASNSLTHSYTVQILISMDGKLGKKLYICFQEAKDTFGPKI
jgi:hypothetical protein